MLRYLQFLRFLFCLFLIQSCSSEPADNTIHSTAVNTNVKNSKINNQQQWSKLVGGGHQKLFKTENNTLYTIGYVNNFKNVIRKWNGNKWETLPNEGAEDITVVGNKLYVIRDTPKFKNIVQEWTGAKWKTLPGDQTKSIVASNGSLYAIRDLKKY